MAYEKSTGPQEVGTAQEANVAKPTQPTEPAQPKQRQSNYKQQSATNFRIFVDAYARGNVRITKGVQYSIREVIEENYLDRNFKFSVPYYSDGEEKLFFSLPYIIADSIYKNTDIDTKDIQIRSDNNEAIDWMPLIRGAVEHYLKTSYYGTKLNEFRKELVDMGHVIVKEVDNETHIVNLLNVVRPPHIANLQKSGIAERTLLSWTDILAQKEQWKDQWSRILDLKKTMDSMQKKTFIVYEWWTMDKFQVGRKLKETKGCIKFLDCSIYEEMVSDVPENWQPYVELERFATPNEEKVGSKKRLARLIASGYLEKGATTEPIYPYEEQCLIPVPGRWMGMGIYELVRPETKAYNKTLNEKLRYDELLHKGVLVHKKAPFSINQKGSGRGLEADIINRIQTGTMISIKAGESIERLNIGSLTADFIASADKWFDIARQKAGVNETAVGEKLPSSMPATIGVLNERQGKTAFDVVNEQQGLFLERLFTKFKLSSIIDDITTEEWTKIIGSPDELAAMEDAFIENLVNTSIQKAAQEGRINPDSSSLPEDQYQQIKTAVKVLRARHGNERPIQLKKELVANFDYYAKFYITSEAFDKQVMLQNLQAAIDTVAANPMVGLDVTKLIEQKLDLMGINPLGLRKTPEQIQAERAAAIAAAGGQAPGGPGQMPMQAEAKTMGEANQMRA